MATLNSVFYEVFGERLKLKGYVKVKGRQPYFARLVDGEILQVITTRNCWYPDLEYKAFQIMAGMASIYRKPIDLTQSPSRNVNWLLGISDYYLEANISNCDIDYREELMGFPYKEENEESLYQAMETAYKETEKHVLGVIDQVTNMEQFIEYLDIYNTVATLSA